MTLDISPILSGKASSLSFDFDVTPDVSMAAPPAGAVLTAPIGVHAEFVSAGITVRLEALATVSYRAVCDRCTDEFEAGFTVSYERYVRDVAADSSNNEESDDVIFDGDGKVCFDFDIVEEAMLSFPARLLCREECLGLCEYCGQNLNNGDCGCAEREKSRIDPRWEALASLYADGEGEN